LEPADVPGATADTKSLADTPRPRARLERGAVLGRFVVLGWLGEGGMGIVYKAYDPELERAVALKLLLTAGDPAASSAAGRRDRLFREAKALARLSHPNVLAVYDVGTFGGDVFLATEFVEGPTLAVWVKEKKRPRAEILAAVLDAGEGLAAAHRAGLVHRDFKPANVIVGADGRVRVLDFGLARSEPSEAAPGSARSGPSSSRSGPLPPRSAPLLPRSAPHPRPFPPISEGREGTTTAPASSFRTASSPPVPPEIGGKGPGEGGQTEDQTGQTRHTDDTPPPSSSTSPSGLLDQTITQLGQILGTPRFMAPEQHLGRTADARSDQFSFCVTLYDALYGELPYEGRGDDYAINVTQGRVRNAPAGSDVPRWLRLILLKGLSVVPGDRFASMDDLLAALRADPGVAQRRWLGIAGGAAVLLCAGLALRHSRPAADPPCRGAERKLAGAWDDARKQAVHAAFTASGGANAEDAYRRTRAALDDYARGWVAMHTDACEATQVRGEQSAEMLDLRVECLGERLEELRAQVDVFAHADTPIVERSVEAARALPRLQACADSAALRAPVRPPSDEPTRARVEAVRTAIAQAKAQQRAGNYASALAIATKSSDDATALGYRPVEAEALFVLGDVQDDRGDYAASEQTLRRSFAASLAGRHEALAARALTALVAEAGLRQAHFAEGHEWAKLAEAEIERSSDPFAKGELARNEGRLFFREDKFDDARAAIERCLAIWEPALGKDDDAVAGPLTDLGNVFYEQGNLDAARAEYARSLAILEKVLGPDSPSLAPNLNNLAELALDRGDDEDAEKNFERARALWERALGPEHPKVALTLYNLARTRRDRGDVAGSLDLAERALAIWQKALPPEHPDVAMGMHGLAEALRAKGDYAGALAADENGLAMRERIYGPNGSELAESLVSIGETRLAQGRSTAAAAAALARALRIMESEPENPLDLARVRFELAQALATTDGARSRALATQARDAFAKGTGPMAQTQLAAVDAWLGRAPAPH
jgi:serine/threonine protein kinase